ncbi:hypothetical protein Skr01_71950 [Sphaerisporangium krabiense]|uniref:C2H2-type domain-containing protein n=1 Tax=Sphaerisporangium krabiense TaxID=763782 RepID=A0A7W8Z7F0_9ACTN|nr:hypothetical protein [Sphaerisporangium krabiense]MBB5628468.1 hypothetical protein [Sphaerisporangium krabiense]GII67110.1 hypothetical protein Skr01_71950 [Sphaerisporangium krabiense]
MRVIMQPASLATPSVRQHYDDTIKSPVLLADHADVLGVDLQWLQQLHPSGSAPMWGMTPGKKNVNVGKYRKLRPGDYVFFYGQKRLYLGGLVTYTFHNPALARRLWGQDDEGQTWEFMYALDDLRGCNIPIEDVRQALPTVGPGWFVQNPYVAEGVAADNLIDLAQVAIGDVALLPSDTVILHDDEATEAPAFSGELERQVQQVSRGEQTRLKRFLLPGATGICALCGRTFERRFLVAAHIKKRTHCTESERRDLANVAMLNCILGCDALYEHGYVAVGPGGTLLISPAALREPSVRSHVELHLKGRLTHWWSQMREPYFAWHRDRIFRTEIPA